METDATVSSDSPSTSIAHTNKTGQAYDDIFLTFNGPNHLGRITAGAIIIIAPPSDDWQANSDNDWKANKDTPLLRIHIKDSSIIGMQSVYTSCQ